MITAFLASVKKFILYLEKLYLERRHGQKRKFERIKIAAPVYAKIFRWESKDAFAVAALLDANDEGVKILTNKAIPYGRYVIELSIPTKKRKRKKAKVIASLWRKYKKDQYVFRYEPVSELNRYLIDQYLLNKSLFSWTHFKVE